MVTVFGPRCIVEVMKHTRSRDGFSGDNTKALSHLTFLVDKRPSNKTSLHHLPPQDSYQKSVEN